MIYSSYMWTYHAFEKKLQKTSWQRVLPLSLTCAHPKEGDRQQYLPPWRPVLLETVSDQRLIFY